MRRLLFLTDSFLWTVTRLDNETSAIEVREVNQWITIARAEVDDPFGDSAFTFFLHPETDHVVLWGAAGQDGQCLYWVHYSGQSISVERFPGLDDTTPPAFDLEGRLFLVVCGWNLRLYEYPSGPELGRLTWPYEDDAPAGYVSFVGQDFALVLSDEGRLFLIHVRTMSIVDEIAIEGHGPKSVAELYPTLRHERGLCSDMSSFLALPNGEFLSVHRELPAKIDSSTPDKMLFWRMPGHCI